MTRAFSVDDIDAYRELSAPHGHDGMVLWAERAADRDRDRMTTHLWMADADGERRLTAGTTDAVAAQCSPDGSHIACLAHDVEGLQIRVRANHPDAAWRCLTRFDRGVATFDWFPDSHRLLVLAHAEDPAPHDAAVPSGATRKHLFVVDVHSGSARAFSADPFDVIDASVSPCGTHVACTRRRGATRAAMQGTDLWVISADGSAARRLTSHLAQVRTPRWSPDGTRIAFAGSTIHEGALQPWLAEAAGPGARTLGPADLRLAADSAPVWTQDGAAVAIVQQLLGVQGITLVSLAGDVTHLLLGCQQVSSLARCGDRFVFVASSPIEPQEVFTMAMDGSRLQARTARNAWWRRREQPRVAHRAFDVPDGAGARTLVYGWVLQPRRRIASARLYVDMSAPAGQQAPVDFARHAYWQVLLARGWSVLALNTAGIGAPVPPLPQAQERCRELDLLQHEVAIDTLRAAGLVGDCVVIGVRAGDATLVRHVLERPHTLRHAQVCEAVGSTPSLRRDAVRRTVDRIEACLR